MLSINVTEVLLFMYTYGFQVVGAVGFQHRRLPIPDNVDPAIANIIQACWRMYAFMNVFSVSAKLMLPPVYA